MIGIVVAQVVATALLAGVALAAFRRFPAAAPVRLDEDRRGILRFVFHSSLATGVVSLRGALAPLLLGIVSKPVQVGFFRIAQAPQQGLASLSAPARLIMLTEQTRDWARGATAVVLAGVRRYTSWAALLMAIVVPPAYILMPWLVGTLYGDDYEGASDAARLVLLAGALHFVFGWSKSLPVSIGRPGLRVLAHGVESVVMIPLVVVLGREWGAEGAAGACPRVHGGLLRDLGRAARANQGRGGVRVLIVTGIWPPDVGGPASHAPELAEHLLSSGHEVAVVTTADGPPRPERYRVDWISRGIPVGARHAGRGREGQVPCAAAPTSSTRRRMIGRAALGSTLARRPLVIKLTTDEAYERARRRGLFDGDMDAFQGVDGDLRVRALRRSRDAALRRATRVICPSAYLREMAVSWGVPPERALVIPNPAPDLPPLPTRDEARAALDIDGPDARVRRADRPPEVAGGRYGGRLACGRRSPARRR